MILKSLVLLLSITSILGNESNLRIFGGSDANIENYPYQVSIRNRGAHHCGGAIIDHKWILTAAHCLIGQLTSKLTIVAGSDRLDNGGVVYQVAEIIPNPLFNTITKHDDIGLIKTNQTIVYNDKIQPIKLPYFGIDDGTKATLTGWGKTTLNGDNPNILQYIQLETISYVKCVLAYNLLSVRPTNVCTLTKVGEGVCHGDSGSPLVRGDEVIGVVSWGTPCATGKPDVYTRVDYYLIWIYATKLGIRP